jgi:hypothetical protein
MEGLALALVPPDDSDFVFVSPIDERCPIGGAAGGGGKGGVFASGKAGSFGLSGQLSNEQKNAVEAYRTAGHGEINTALRSGTGAHLERLQSSLTDKSGFLHAFGQLKADTSLNGQDIKTLAHEFTGFRAKSKAQALDLIFDRHESLMNAGSRNLITSSRTAG